MKTQLTSSANKKPILLTGSHRSGSTWAGRMITKAPNVGYIFEPFNIKLPLSVNSKAFDHNFLHICKENEDSYRKTIDEVINFEYPFWFNVNRITKVDNIGSILRDKSHFLWHKWMQHRALIKDPIAFFSAEWLYDTYQMDVVMMIRHPAAFCSSLKIKNWQFDFNNFVNQPLLIEDYLQPFESQIHDYARKEHDIIEQSILLWNCFHHTILQYKEKHPNWSYIRHEDLSISPIDQYQKIYNNLNLDFTNSAREEIIKTSGGHNPVEQQFDNEFVRNSRENIMNWKKRLSTSEIKEIQLKTEMIASHYYDDSNW
ncbi:MAG: sulfotransferase [Thiohalomonas sp.]|nr:sulfotransferase [Thiohalomonas sp.]